MNNNHDDAPPSNDSRTSALEEHVEPTAENSALIEPGSMDQRHPASVFEQTNSSEANSHASPVGTSPVGAVHEDKVHEDKVHEDKRRGDRDSRSEAHPIHLATSTFLSLVMVLAILLFARWMVPPLVEGVRYGWYRGQLRAEYEVSGQRLKSVSLDSLADVSRLVSQRLGPSVVHINVRRRPPEALSAMHADWNEYAFEGQGSGFVIDASGYIMTNQHVLEGGTDIEVTLSDGRQVPAQIVATDRHTDLAVLQVETQGLMPIEWGDSDEIIVGTPVWAVGSPFGLQQTVTFGIISGKHRVDFRMTAEGQNVARRGGTPYGDLMQSDVALNPGNSGGPLVNTLGQVIGVNAAILGETFQGVSFSIPSNVAKRVGQLLIAEGEVPRGWLGVELDELAQQERFYEDGRRRFGVRVRRFPTQFSSPAKRAGLKVDDIIVTFDGRPVTDRASLIRMIGESPVGAVITLGVDRPVVTSLTEVEVEAGVKEVVEAYAEATEFAPPSKESTNKVSFSKIEIKVKLGRRNPAI